jgi:hypothetical protein
MTRPVPRARPYLGLLLLFPSLVVIAAGWWGLKSAEPGGSVTSIQLTTKPGLSGQASESISRINPDTPDIYLKLETSQGWIRLPTRHDTPVGSGLRWGLERALRLSDVLRVEIWEEDAFRDDIEDQITPSGWAGEGGTYRIELIGEPNRPPEWALPVLCVGCALAGMVLVRFVWDQVI